MRGHVRTILAAVAVLAVCLLLAVLSWQLLLTAFFLGGVGWAFWSLSKSSRQTEQELERQWRKNRERAGSKRRKALRRGNIYEFPIKALRRQAPPL